MREALAIAGWIVASIVAFLFAPQLEPLVKEIPIISGLVADNCELSMIGAFAIVFAIALIIASLITPLFSSLVKRSALGGLDQGIGFIFGVARGILLVAIAYFVYETVITGQDIQMIDDSRSARVFGQMTSKVEDGNPEQALSWIAAQYEALIGACDASNAGGVAPASGAITPATTE